MKLKRFRLLSPWLLQIKPSVRFAYLQRGVYEETGAAASGPNDPYE